MGATARRRGKDRGLYLMVAALSALAFCCVYGVRILLPTYTDWLLVGGDLSQHYLGWVAYRSSPWTFPIGLTNILAYPDYTSVIFTDSIPLFAVFFKLLSPLLPESFQYFGLWGLTCFVLQGILSAKIIRGYTDNRAAVIFGSLLVVFTPAVFKRLYGHEALAGQWIILLALDLIFSRQKYERSPGKLYLTVAGIGILTVSIHMYFLLMCSIIVFSWCVADLLYTKRLKRPFLVMLDLGGSALTTIWLLGGFVATGSSYSEGGVGLYSMNWNSLVNSMGMSSVLKPLPLHTGEQWEGFGYLGLGIILLTGIVVVFSLFDRAAWKGFEKHGEILVGLGCVCLLSVIAASQTEAFWGTTKLYSLRLPRFVLKVWGVFRASGRCVMVLDYVTSLSCVILTVKLFRKRPWIPAALLCAALAVQIYDIHSELESRHVSLADRVVYESPLHPDGLWDAAGENGEIKHMVVTFWPGENEFYELGEWALKNDLTMNFFVMVHARQNEVRERAAAFLEDPTPEELFIFSRDDLSALGVSDYGLVFYDAGEYVIGYAGELPGAGAYWLDVSPLSSGQLSY